MIRYAAILGALLIMSPTVTVNSEPLHPVAVERNYETAYNQTDLVADSPAQIPNIWYKAEQTHYVHVTGYSSTPDQTDDTPFITASGSHVKDGIVAANWLPLGTKVKIPELFGDKVFTVEDRMNKRFSDRMDIWFETRDEAQAIGKQYTPVIVL
ncbi:MAG: hypothetical protein COV57_02430 [Candidatus Liptonbacteria bacterium CG11_big_fil_rev_8_21_14_0_20_35_14]|uniref:3D domain-containing protein n=1 Tax=Candidatus Liptonbacteria bacterium CG11_big_fil_rev_8_21_14_0_20_35_14 TaxID=1974634 RepID=A0A2H0N7D9_9BACT|nr:MAG: hypothetical protein COV57_02430 [Candidatus Liptonbacteria bacterium CG11_big_fil_rev_8_21_14_0_20_35_14]